MDIRAHFYTPFGVMRNLEFCIAPKSPLCKGMWAGKSLLGGIVNPSVSFADSSLCTREPWVLPRQCKKILPARNPQGGLTVL